MNRKQQIGKTGEEKACRYLKRRGYEILERNYRIRNGELDIVAQKHDELVFVEVKTRTSCEFGTPAEAVNGYKQQHLLHTARHYIHTHQLYDKAARFDVIEVRLEGKGLMQKTTIHHIPNAFQE